MGTLKIILVTLFAIVQAAEKEEQTKVLCYYNTKADLREGQGKFDLNFIDPALQFCSHLIYGFAGINSETYKLQPLNDLLDVNKNHYRQVTNLKKQFPGLTVLLSVGGGEDIEGEGYDKNIKYRNILESVDNRLTFVNSAHQLVKNYGFDGLDLAWEFPETKPKKIHSTIGGLWSSFKHKIVSEKPVDEKAEEHKEQFTALVREMRNTFRHDGLRVTVSVLPNVNSTLFYDPRALNTHVDFVTLQAFDFYTPERNPKEADYPSPLYELLDRKVDENVDYQVKYWLGHSFPNNKLILGIPTYGRAWKMTEDSQISGVPPLTVEGPADAGPYTKEAGLLSYPEVCAKLSNPQNLQLAQGTHLRKVGDPTKRYGTYAFRLPDSNEKGGIWVGYEDPDTAGNKASYARAKGLGGVAILDITLDDFRGLCAGDKYPILRAAKFRL